MSAMQNRPLRPGKAVHHNGLNPYAVKPVATCGVCGDTEPFHAHKDGIRTENYFVIGRGHEGNHYAAARAWRKKAMLAQQELTALRAEQDTVLTGRGEWLGATVEESRDIPARANFVIDIEPLEGAV